METDLDSKPLCSVCKLKEFKYTCPRCNIQYCSTSCYKAPGHFACSESFYQEWFVQEMKERKVSFSEQERVLSMLQRVEEETPIDEYMDQASTLEERLQALNLSSLKEKDTEKLWDILTPDERERFKAAVQKGEIYDSSGCSLTQPWKPWWTTAKSLIEDINKLKDISSALCPKIIKVPELMSLLPKGKNLSPLVAFNLVNTLYPYVLFQRLYNGCGTSDFVKDFSCCCIKASLFLDQNQTFLNAEEALNSAIRFSADTCQNEHISVKEAALTETIKDVGQILTGPAEDKMSDYICSALSDLHFACSTHKRSLKKNSNTNQGDGYTSAKQLFSIIKKLEFLISWSSHQNACLPLLAMEVFEIYKQKKAELKAFLEISQSVVRKPNTPKPPLIQEIN
uniref:Zinc finger HIT domain-containing protein 2-like n=1 Tax=Phallusia mammillata TaxID=59560 RepID=A0A6F9DY37_9ASCI|nr:zinc finger HIT domain-containing protein 2-like [Phallusia mammillata]